MTRLSATLIERLPSGAVRVYSGASVLCVFSSLNPLSIYRENNKPSGISYYDNAGNQYIIDLHQLTSIVGSGTVQTYNAVDTTSSSDEYVNKVLSCFEFISSEVAVGYAPGPTFVGGVVASYPNFASFPATGTESVIYIDESVPQAYIWDGSAYQLLISQNVESYASMASFPVTGTADVLYVDLSTFTGYVYSGGAYHALGGGAIWGSITGTLSSQSDLVAALAAKFNNPTGTTSQYLRGDGSLATFPTIPAQFNPTAGTGMSITGTYPNQTFTNTAPDQTVSITAGTGISVTGTYPNFTVVNTSPDQTVALTAGTGITITGTYPNFTITNSSPSSGGTVTAVTATSPLASSGGTTPDISIPASNSTTNGYLSSSDWLTFNNKFNTPTGTTLQYVRGDGSLATFPAIPSGTVTSVATAGLISGGPITSSGTITTSMSTNKLVGRSTAGTGIMEEISVGSGLTLTGGTLTNTATPTPLGYYGAWQDQNTQTAAASNVGYAMQFHTADITPNGISIVNDGSGNPTRITFAYTGIYNIQFSSQFQNTDSQLHDVTIWLRLNGVDVSGSAGLISVPVKHGATNGHVITGWNYVLDVVGGQYYEIIWSTDAHTNVTMQYYAAGSPPPAVASVILTVTQQSGIMAGTGMTALNGLTGAVQTFATGTTGTDFGISSSGTTHTFNLPTASSINRGALSTTDWSTFNNKQDAITLTTTGTSGAATLVGSTLNIPNYATASQPVKLTSQTLSAASWSYSGGYYQYTFSNVNIDTTCDISVSPQNASYMTAYSAQILPYIAVGSGSATFYSLFPAQDDIVVDIVITQTV